MSIFAGLAQGFAQGAMAAMPAATDRYVQARRRAKERKQTIEDRKTARAQNLEDERRREMVGLKTTFAKLGGRDLGENATPEMYRNEIAAYTIDDEYNSKRNQLQQSGIDPTGMDHSEIDQAYAGLGATTNQATENALAIQKSNIESNRIKSLDGYDAYKNLEKIGRANPTTMIVRDGDGKITGFNFTPMNEAFEAKRQEENDQKNQSRLSKDEPYSIINKQSQLEQMNRTLEFAQEDGGLSKIAKMAIEDYKGDPTAATWSKATRAYGAWYVGGGGVMGDGEAYGVAADRQLRNTIISTDYNQDVGTLGSKSPDSMNSITSSFSTAGTSDSTSMIPIGDSKPNTTNSIIPSPVSADTLTAQEELELIERAEKGDEEAIRRLGL